MTVIHGFELVQEKWISEINTRARLFRHIKTGAELLSLENDDENKVFGVSFRTPPPDSTGLPHILEHSVLCGSRKYPVKEPFVELLKGSLKTFLNAFTSPDKTTYPVASQNRKDFYNLVDVYLDAVFHPLLSPYTLQQEGWHYELEDPQGELSYKGVVFNEMKGAYSSPDSLIYRYTQQALFPDNPYALDAGGDPAVIPDLTYAQFKSFYEQYYHPSNARLYFYGDDHSDDRLALVNEYLKDFSPVPVQSSIPLQPRFAQPKKVVFGYDAGQEAGDHKKKAMLTTSWLLEPAGDPFITLSLNILEHILIGTPASPLRKALIESGLGEDLTGVGLNDGLVQSYFSTGLKGIAVEDAEKVEQLIFNTLSALAREGIDPDMVAASLNTIEFRLREMNTGAFPRGLMIFMQVLGTWLYDGDPFKLLAFEEPLNAIKGRLAAGEKLFEEMIRKYFLENSHQLTLLLKPDPEIGAQREAAERQRLAQARAAMSDSDLAAIIENTRELKRRQTAPDAPEDLAKIPSLTLADLDREIKRIPLEKIDAGGSTVLYHDLSTNGIVYLDLGLNLHILPQELLPYVGLFGRAILEMGTETEDYVRLSQRIGKYTGGIRVAPFTSMVSNSDNSAAWLFIRGKATVDRGRELLFILQDILNSVRLDNLERFRQIALAEKAEQEAYLVPGGNQVVNTRLRAFFNEADWAAEQISGPSYLFFLRQLIDRLDHDWGAVLEDLKKVHRTLVNRNALICNITLDRKNWDSFQPQLMEFLDRIDAGPANSTIWKPGEQPYHEGFTIPAQVNFVGKGADLYQLGYVLHGSILVITKFLRTTWLWERVRVQGGAYGGSCMFDHRSGVFTYLSYRDPNLLKTLENYDTASQFLRELDDSRLNSEELVKTIVGTIGELDAYQFPDAKGFTSMVRFLTGDTDDKRQKLRDEVLSTTREDFRMFAEFLEKVNQQGRVVVMGAPEALQAVNVERAGWLDIKKLL